MSRWMRPKELKNAGWLVGGKLVNKLLAFGVSILTARYLGPGEYGLIHYVAAYTTFFAAICNLGLPTVLVKEFVAHPQRQGSTLGTALLLRGVSSVLSALMIVGVVFVADGAETVTLLVAALSGLGLVFQIFDSFQQWFQARLQSKYVAVATVTAYLAMSGYKVLLLISGKSVIWFALAAAVDHLVLAVVLIFAYRRCDGPKLEFSWKRAGELLRDGSGFVLSGLMISVYAATDKLMLKQMLEETVVGYYAMAVSLGTVWTFLLQAVIDSVHPAVIHAYEEGSEAFYRVNRRLYGMVVGIAVTASLALTLTAQPLVELLYGQAYLPAVRPMQIVVWGTAFSYLGVARNAWVVCENRQKDLKYLYAGGALTNVVLNLLLIPLWGASGAALASVVTQAATAVVLPAFLPTLRPNVTLILEGLIWKDLWSRQDKHR